MTRITGFTNFNPYQSARINSVFRSSRSSNLSYLSGMLGNSQRIRNSSYAKLLKAYYGKDDANQKTTASRNTRNSQQTGLRNMADSLASVKGDAEDLGKAADKLAATGKDSVFEKKPIKQEDGSTVTDYDTDAIYNAVNSFVKNYNDTLKNASFSSDKTVSNAANSMARSTSFLSKSLAKIGITAEKNGTLSLDKDAFQKADMETVKNLFQGTGSYGGNMSYAASRIQNAATKSLAAVTGGTYGRNASFGYGGYGGFGNYSNYYGLGSFFNGYF